MDSTSLVPELSLGQFKTVTRQVGRSKNGTNRKVRKQTKATTKPGKKANVRGATSVASKRNSSSSSTSASATNANPASASVTNVSPASASTSNGKPRFVNPDEPKLSTKSGKVPHSSRPSVTDSHGVHVTVKLRSGIPNLRQKHVIEVLERCFSKAKDRFEFELTAYTVMSNHFHFLVFVRSNEALRRGMQGLNIRLARAINRLFNRKGKVFADRFHARVIRGFYAIKKVLRYVVQNARKHQLPIPAGKWDRYSSGHYRHAHSPTPNSLPILRASGSFPIMCATLQLLPSEFPGPHNSADPIW